jgi:integrase
MAEFKLAVPVKAAVLAEQEQKLASEHSQIFTKLDKQPSAEFGRATKTRTATPLFEFPIVRQCGADSIGAAAVPARKRGKRMSRRSGQNPSVRIGKRADGRKYYFFQFWDDVAGEEERQRKTQVVGLVSQMTKCEAERKKLEFISNLKINSGEYQIPSSANFAHAVKQYRDEFAPEMLRESTFSTADYHLKKHLEPDWSETPIEHITIDAVNEWAKKKRKQGLSWVTIKNILRTMQRVLSASSKDRKPPFSLKGLVIPERDKLQMRINSRKAESHSWEQTNQIAAQVRERDDLATPEKGRYETLFILADASGLRCGELFALRMNDLNFKAGTIRVDEAVCARTSKLGLCKNASAHRTVVLADHEGQEAMRKLKAFVSDRYHNSIELVFSSRLNTPLRESNVLRAALHPALKALGLPKAGMHAFRHGCNRRWELAGLNPAVLRQQMGHSSYAMTARYTGEIPTEQVQAAFSVKNGRKIVVLENMENEVLA